MINLIREPGQGTSDEFKNKDYRRDLEEKERQIRKEKDKVLCTQIKQILIQNKNCHFKQLTT